MAIDDCIREARRRGHLNAAEAQLWEARFHQLVAAGMRPHEVRAQIIQEIEAQLLDAQRRGLLMQIVAEERVLEMMAHRDRRGAPNASEAFKLLHSAEAGQAKFVDLHHKAHAIFRQWLFELDELVYEFRKGWLTGDRRRQGGWVGSAEVKLREANLVRELFGEATQDPIAQRLANAVRPGLDALRQRFNAGGGAIGHRADYGLPTYHDPEALRRVTQQQWIDRIEPLLDHTRMHHPLTGTPLTRAELRQSLEYIYPRIISEGWNTRTPDFLPDGRGALAAQRQDHRFLVFRKADDWLAYQKDFGLPDVFSTIVGHAHSMSKDIAALETFGPNPTAMRAYLEQVARKSAAPGDPRAGWELYRANDIWDYVRGTTHTPAHTTWANVFANVRNVIGAATLGGSSISSLSDFATAAVRRAFTGLPVTSTLTDMVGQLGRGSLREAARHGLILEEVTSAFDQQARFVGAIRGSQWSKYMLDRVLQLNGLSPMTNANKRAFGLEMQATLADQVGRAWADLPDVYRRLLDRHGFDAVSWDMVRQAPLHHPHAGSAGFLRPREVAQAAGVQLADRYVAMIERETTMAIPEATPASASLFISGTRPGSAGGEFIRSVLQFKGFPIAFATLQIGHIAREIMGGRGAQGAAYAGAMLVSMTLLGGLAIQIKELVMGRDPRDMTKPEFWGAALIQGGGAGIWGDFLLADVNRFGGGWERTLLGPTADRAQQLYKLTAGNLRQAADDKKTNFGRELAQFIGQNTPGGTLPYVRLAYERLLLDQLQYLTDPEAHRAWQRAAQRRRREFGNEFWWPRGELGPTRAPDLGAALGQ